MDVRHRLELAGTGLLGMLDAARNYLPTNGYEVAHDLGRWWDAALRLEETIGFEIPPELENISLRNLQWLTDNPDRLLMNRTDVPWLAAKARINPHNFRETLLAMERLTIRRQNRWARDAALHLVGSLDRAFQADGHLDRTCLGSWGQVPDTQDPSHMETARDGWFDSTATSGRALEALVYLYKATDEAMVLGLAKRIAGHQLAMSVNRNGVVRKEIIAPENAGHDHSFHGTLRGLLLYGLLTGQKEYIETVEATYRNGIRNRIVKESGWAPHDLGMVRFTNSYGDPVADPASAGDSAQLALWLALDAGCHDLLDDVERLVRARLLPAQITEEDIRRQPERKFAARETGAWCIHGPSHGGKGCTPDVLAAVTHTLCDVYRHIRTDSAEGIRINLHLDYEDDDIRTTSTRADGAEFSIQVKRPKHIMVRVPGWAPASTVRFTVDGRAVIPVRNGTFARIPEALLRPGSVIVLSHDLPRRQTEEQMPSGRAYRFSWIGDEIAGISPVDGPTCFYPEICTGFTLVS